MFYKRSVSVLSLSLMLGALGNNSFARPAPPQDLEIPEPIAVPEIDTDQFIIRFKDTANPIAVNKVLERLQKVKGEKFKYVRTNQTAAHVFKLDKRKDKQQFENMKGFLKTHPEVDYVEPDYIMQPQALPNDNQFSYQWALIDTVVGIHADQAWELSTGANTVVAVVDSGVRPHADLVANLLPGYDMIADLAVAVDGNGRDADASDPGDYRAAGECGATSLAKNSGWHGTHVAGTVGAVANNAIGVAGVAYNAKILPVRVLGKCGGYTSDIADAILWAAGVPVSGAPSNPNPAKVINLSLGGTYACTTTTQNAINAARARGAVLVVAAGNSAQDASTHSPANCAGVITVGATARDGSRAAYSNYGAIVDLAAPGGGSTGGILSTLNAGTQLPDADSYAFYQGTSMATPHVSGVAALMLSLNPFLTPDQVESSLKSTVSAFPVACEGCGVGLLNAYAAVKAVPADAYTALRTTWTSSYNLWRSKAITSYTYTLEQKIGTQTAQSYRFTVKNGVVVAGINISTNKALGSRDLRSKGKTLEQLFTLINSAINNRYSQVTVSYDTTVGYPTSLYLDPNALNTSDHASYTISNVITP